MNTLKHSFLLCVAALALTLSASANPTPTESPRLKDAIRWAVEHGRQEDCGELPDLLARTGFAFLREETLRLIHRNFHTLAPCMLASQRSAKLLDPTLHREFREHASAPEKAAMCALLRDHLVMPRETQGLAVWPVSLVIQAAEILSDYRDQAALPRLQSIMTALQGSAVDTMWSPHGDRVSWYFGQAMRRIENPDAGLVLRRDDVKHLEFVRSGSDVVACELRSDKALDLKWHSVSIPPDELDRLFRLLATDSVPFAGGTLDITVRLRVHFQDGIAARLYAGGKGVILYEDNQRNSDHELVLVNQELAGEILAFADRIKESEPTTKESVE